MLVAISFAAGFAAPSTELSLEAVHVYNGRFADGPQPAIENTCTAYTAKPATDYLKLSSSFYASAGGEVWEQDSLLFSLSGALADGATASLHFSNVTTSNAPFLMRISAPSVGPAETLSFKAHDDASCPSEHCLLPKPNLQNLDTPKCGFDHPPTTLVVEQPISPNLPSASPLLVDVTSLLSKTPTPTTTLKVSLVPDKTDSQGFWGPSMQISNTQLIVSSAPTGHAYCCTSCSAGGCSAFYSPKDVGPPYACSKGEVIEKLPGHGSTCKAPADPHAYCCTSCSAGGCSAFYSPTNTGDDCTKGATIEKLPGHGQTCKAPAAMPAAEVEGAPAAGGCSAADQKAIGAKGGGTGAGTFPKITSDCSKGALSIFSGIDESKFNTCLTGAIAGVSTTCSSCFYQAAEYGYKNCKVACLASWCSAACISCASKFSTASCAGFTAPAPTPC